MTEVEGAPDPSEVYDEAYATRYDGTWWESDVWAVDGAYHLDLFRRWLVPGAGWLDVGCGTGWMLSHFQEQRRAGIDISESMLVKAREVNPGVELRCADVLAPHAPWDDQWDLVTCTGQPWSYLLTLRDFETWVERMAAWTSPEGVCINQVPDILELTGNATDYHLPPEDPPVGLATVLAVHWTMDEPTTQHGPMIWPSLDVWVRWFGRYFARVEVVHGDDPDLRFPRFIVASEKRTAEGGPLTVVYDPPSPTTSDEPAPETPTDAERLMWAEENRLAWEANELAWADNQERWAENAAAWAEAQALTASESERANRAEVALDRCLRTREEGLSLCSTKALARALLARMRPRRLLGGLRRRLRAR